jgi:hypothetical protein
MEQYLEKDDRDTDTEPDKNYPRKSSKNQAENP